jgi:hypothetical protein
VKEILASQQNSSTNSMSSGRSNNQSNISEKVIMKEAPTAVKSQSNQ